MTEISLEEFREIAKKFNVIPVWQRLFADNETPLSLYRKLSKNLPGTFLLESAEHGGAWSRFSFIGVSSQATLTEKDGAAFWEGAMPNGAPIDVNPLDALKKAGEFFRSPLIPDLPPLTGGLVGYLGYDAVRNLEVLPNIAIEDLNIPNMAYMLTTDLAIFDHFDGTLTLISNAINWDGSDKRVDEAYEKAKNRLSDMIKDLRNPILSTVNKLPRKILPKFTSSINHEKYLRHVENIK